MLTRRTNGGLVWMLVGGMAWTYMAVQIGRAHV
jgi:hypothetical protein